MNGDVKSEQAMLAGRKTPKKKIKKIKKKKKKKRTPPRGKPTKRQAHKTLMLACPIEDLRQRPSLHYIASSTSITADGGLLQCNLSCSPDPPQ
jgi:hypothetical protein